MEQILLNNTNLLYDLWAYHLPFSALYCLWFLLIQAPEASCCDQPLESHYATLEFP